MSAKTGIQWTDHTFNIAWGCTKVSPGCANCYAETLAKRYGFDVWGPGKDRRLFGEKHWNEPRKWNRAAEKEGRRHRVFCSSMADVFEDHPTIDAERAKLSKLIGETPWLDWQILTKRADRLREIAELVHFFHDAPPAKNVWFGVSVENQETADERIPNLLATPAAVRFVSFEPLLGPVVIDDRHMTGDEEYWNFLSGRRGVTCQHRAIRPESTARIDWVIVGGESGPGARPMHPDWARSIRDQCAAASVPFFFKQWGEWALEGPLSARQCCVDRTGRFVEPLQRDLFPRGASAADGWQLMYRIGKKKARRLLGGREWNEMPR